MSKRILVVQVAALGHDLLLRHLGRGTCCSCDVREARSVAPALTCTVQGSFRTAARPGEHGMLFNGHYLRELRRPMFWEQSSRLVEGERIWDGFRARGGRVGMLFWQQSLGEHVDVLLSPAPIHTHGGGLVDAVYSQPDGLYDRLADLVGRRFRLRSYWGPLASTEASRWISAATCALLGLDDERPDLLLTYLPHLDYTLQRHRTGTFSVRRALDASVRMLEDLHRAAERAGFEVLVFGDYAIGEATRVVYPNRKLLGSGLFRTRSIGRRRYPDFHRSRAFAVVDHEVAFVYVQDSGDIPDVRRALADEGGGYEVLDAEAMRAHHLAHPRAPEIMLMGAPGTWFAYPWWKDRAEAPDYASHVDIHNKPGYDPCELFFGWPPPSVGQDPRRIRGTHGAVEPGRSVAWWSTWDLGREVVDVVDVAKGVKEALDGCS
jgi:predicted AlkP superfamily pyrophosphatase or phosphodiesterase